MKTFYVVKEGRDWQDNYVEKIKAKDETEARKEANRMGGYLDRTLGRKKFTKHNIKAMKNARKKGAAWTDIAWHYGVTAQTIKNYVNKQGV